MLNRRAVVIGLPLSVGLGVRSAMARDDGTLAAIEKRHGGRLGVFALDTASGRTLAHRADERFLMCSTFKGLLVAQVFAKVDAGRESLSRMIAYTASDLIFTSPVTKANLGKGEMSVGELARAVLEYSDNTAAILLMRSAGGPPGLTAFLRSLGDTVTRSDRYEPTSNRYSGALDTTTPRAIVGSAHKILLGDVLKADTRAQLEAGMAACKPGGRRIRASLPEGWFIGDRTGENVTEESNDYAIVRPPGRAPLLIAVYYHSPKMSAAEREAVIREAGSAFVAWAQG
ncbi:class A beta-lactamase [Labrys monachus]|nr:class A beta-lactamase [Labrys monachus]